jgi:hypothetical protein
VKKSPAFHSIFLRRIVCARIEASLRHTRDISSKGGCQSPLQ